jgi:hypothetical protein
MAAKGKPDSIAVAAIRGTVKTTTRRCAYILIFAKPTD